MTIHEKIFKGRNSKSNTYTYNQKNKNARLGLNKKIMMTKNDSKKIFLIAENQDLLENTTLQ